MKRLLFWLLAFASLIGLSLAQTPAPVVSPEVHADNTVTFRLRMPNAVAVTVALEGAKPSPMTKDDQGVCRSSPTGLRRARHRGRLQERCGTGRNWMATSETRAASRLPVRR